MAKNSFQLSKGFLVVPPSLLSLIPPSSAQVERSIVWGGTALRAIEKILDDFVLQLCSFKNALMVGAVEELYEVDTAVADIQCQVEDVHNNRHCELLDCYGDESDSCTRIEVVYRFGGLVVLLQLNRDSRSTQ